MFQRYSKQVQERLKIWKTLLSTSMIISLTYLSACPNFIHALIQVIYGEKWANTPAPDLLGFYGIYLLVISINGLVESLRDAVASDYLIQKQNDYLFVFIIFYFLVASLGLYFFGALGLTMASTFSTLIRLLFHMYHFKTQIFSILEGIPSNLVLAIHLATFVIGAIARRYFATNSTLIAFGVCLGMVHVVILFLIERPKYQRMFKIYSSSKKEQ